MKPRPDCVRIGPKFTGLGLKPFPRSLKNLVRDFYNWWPHRTRSPSTCSCHVSDQRHPSPLFPGHSTYFSTGPCSPGASPSLSLGSAALTDISSLYDSLWKLPGEPSPRLCVNWANPDWSRAETFSPQSEDPWFETASTLHSLPLNYTDPWSLSLSFSFFSFLCVLDVRSVW